VVASFVNNFEELLPPELLAPELSSLESSELSEEPEDDDFELPDELAEPPLFIELDDEEPLPVVSWDWAEHSFRHLSQSCLASILCQRKKSTAKASSFMLYAVINK